MSVASLLTPDRINDILDTDLANIVAKSKAGKTLTAAERERLEELREQQSEHVKTEEDLASRLGVDRRTISRWQDDPSFPKKVASGWPVLAVRHWVTLNDKSAAKRALVDAEREERIDLMRVKRGILTGDYCKREEVQLVLTRAALSLERELARLEVDFATTLPGLTAAEIRRAAHSAFVGLRERLAEGEWGKGQRGELPERPDLMAEQRGRPKKKKAA